MDISGTAHYQKVVLSKNWQLVRRCMDISWQQDKLPAESKSWPWNILHFHAGTCRHLWL